MKDAKLFSPLKIGKLELKNRIVMAPMSLGFGSQDGTVSEKLSEFWEERAKGGVGLIMIDAVTVDTAVPYLGPTISLGDDKFIAPLSKFIDKIHSYGAKVFPQITHPGPESISWAYGVDPKAPSAYHNDMGKPTSELSLEEIKKIIPLYGDAARRAKEAGCDGMELHAAHAYMMAGAFLSPLRNKRSDEYGGNLEARAKFTIEVLQDIRKKVGEDFPIIMRISGDERLFGGNTAEDMLALVPKFVEAGASAFEVSGGAQYELPWKIIPCHYEQLGVNVKEATAIKKAVDVPVFVVGKVNNVQFAEHLISSGKVDGVVLGRPLLADPALVNKALEGRLEDIAPCASCGGGCITRDPKNPIAKCNINAALGREKEMQITEAKDKKKVLVIGGGPAGLETARVAAMRGHKVTLMEKSERLGGQVNLAVVAPGKQEITGWLTYLIGQAKKYNVDIRLNEEVTAESAKEIDADVIVVATGSAPFTPNIKGKESANIICGHDVLAGRENIIAGNVLVIGGGLVGCELADTISSNARGPMKVEIIEMMDEVASGLCPNNKKPLLRRLTENGVKLSPSTKLLALDGDKAIIEQGGVEKTLSGFTHIVSCCGTKPVNELAETLKGSAPEIFTVGDAIKPAQVLEAVTSGSELARTI